MSKGLNVEDPSGMSVSQVTDEVLYACLVEMQELPELEEWRGEGECTGGRLSIHKVVSHVFLHDGRKRIKPVRYKGVLPVAPVFAGELRKTLRKCAMREFLDIVLQHDYLSALRGLRKAGRRCR